MKKHTHPIATTLFTAFLCLALLAPLAQAQETPTMYAATDYMKSSDVQDYLEIEKSWKKLHQKLVDEGHMLWWGLYEVTAPWGSDRPYDYVTVRIYTDFSTIENPFPDEYFASTFEGYSEAQLDELMAKTGASRSIVNSEYFVRSNYLETNGAEASKYLIVDYMDTPSGGASAYRAIENDAWKPLHEQRVKDGYIQDWQLWTRLFTGTNDEYDHATTTGYDNFGDLVNSGINAAMAKKAHPNATEEELNKMMEATGASRDLVRQHVWTLIDQTAVPAQ